MSDNQLKVVTFYWYDPNAKHHGTYEFGADHVNKLQRALKKHLHVDHELVCITDNPDGLDVGNIRVVPLWSEFRDLGRCFVRLGLYSSDMRSIIGSRIAQIDLDVVITGDVTPIFTKPGDFVGYRDSKNPRCYSGAFYIMDAGAKEQVYTGFKRFYYMFPEKGRREHFLSMWNRFSPYVGSDQSWQTEILGEHSGLPKIGQDDGVWDYWNIEHLPDLPRDTRMVFMNGMTRDPSIVSFQEKHPWIKEHWVNI